MANLEIVPATALHFEQVYGEKPSKTIRGYAGLVDGRAVSIGGVYYLNDQLVAFCNILPGYEYLKALHAKGCIKVLRMIKDMKVTVYAVADKDKPQAEDFIMRCGFSYLRKGPNGEVFICKP